MDLRERAALLIGKSVRIATRLFGSGGGALPGLIAYRLAPTLLSTLSQQCSEGVILICGTNGKTTTSRMLASIITSNSGLVHNRSGSNLTRGHLAAFLEMTSWSGKVLAPRALLEVDEAVFPETLRLTKPSVVVWHNLFRDQLDRYGEVDSIAQKWLAAVKKDLPSKSTLVVNADDPNLSYIAEQSNHPQITFFGLDDEKQGTKEPLVSVDAYLSPVSGKPLHYKTYYVSHLGEYSDPLSNFSRPVPNISAKNITLNSTSSQFQIEETTYTLPLPGLYNIYNALAASVVAKQLGFTFAHCQRALSRFQTAFGRYEQVKIGAHQVIFCLIKNPAGAAEVLRSLAADSESLNIVLFAHDNFADGTDVSWYFDTPFELISPKLASAYCTGTRGLDMALRLKYAGASCPIETKYSITDLMQKWQKEASGKTYCLCTYTATLEIQKLLTAQGFKTAFHAE